ncbi:hypothetical protein K0M31_008417 [Melipona bicolor]|uniref:Uncharacterized protein n=1 Tax=Melipona bicolor TaxID=60889 RepID=A0AA40FRS5_9HYME|nr:hypothetical protein K0M31_008417 [Melipona bicolor]
MFASSRFPLKDQPKELEESAYRGLLILLPPGESTRGSDELLSQSGAVSNGAAMSPQPHHAADNNNDAKKVGLFSNLLLEVTDSLQFLSTNLAKLQRFEIVPKILVERRKKKWFASSVSFVDQPCRQRREKNWFPLVAEGEKRGEVGDADVVEGGSGKYLLLSVTRDGGRYEKMSEV